MIDCAAITTETTIYEFNLPNFIVFVSKNSCILLIYVQQ